MKPFAAVIAALMLTACAGTSTSQSIIARPLLNTTTVGGPGYPIVIDGAESVGLTPVTLAQSLRFPPRLRAGSSFRAISGDQAPPTHAHLGIVPAGDRAQATLTFLHGDRRTGVGTFSLPRGQFSDPQAVGSVSSALIDTMLRDARIKTSGDNTVRIP